MQTISRGKLSCDLFASSTNNRLKKYYSKIASPNCAGINAFAQDWSKDFNYCCPPVKLIPDVIQHLKINGSHGILVVPWWPGAIFWPLLTLDGCHLHTMFYKFHIFRPTFRKGEFCDSNLFDGYRSNFSMIGLIFNSTVPLNEKPNINRCLMGGCEKCKHV